MWIGTRWCSYHTSTGLILKCTSLHPLPQGAEWGSFFRNQAKGNSGRPESDQKEPEPPFYCQASLYSNGPNGERLGWARGSAKGKELTEQFPQLVLAPEMHLYLELGSWLWNLKAELLPTLALPLILCVCFFMSLFPLFTPAFSCSHRHTNGKQWEGKHSPTLCRDRTVMTTLDLVEALESVKAMPSNKRSSY